MRRVIAQEPSFVIFSPRLLSGPCCDLNASDLQRHVINKPALRLFRARADSIWLPRLLERSQARGAGTGARNTTCHHPEMV